VRNGKGVGRAEEGETGEGRRGKYKRGGRREDRSRGGRMGGEVEQTDKRRRRGEKVVGQRDRQRGRPKKGH